jgi:hypothetical protein
MFSEACQGPEKLMAWYVLIRPCLYKYVILDFSDTKLVLPAGQHNLTAPTSDPSFVLLAIGFQNYTCGAAGAYT